MVGISSKDTRVGRFRDLQKKLTFTKQQKDFQKKRGKLTAFERLNLLLDKDSFTEIGAFEELHSDNYGLPDKKQPRDGVIIGHGLVHGRPVYVFAQDFTFMGGSMGEVHNKKIARVMEFAQKHGAPCVGLFDSGGARIQEGISALDAGGGIFKNNTLMSGVVPQISLILGPCAGIAAYSPALTDFVFMVEKTSYMFITGPNVIKTVTGEEIDFEGLGGAGAQSKSGVAHVVSTDEKACFEDVRLLLTYLPQNNVGSPLSLTTKDSPTREMKDLGSLIPADSKKAYDIRDVITRVVDKHTFFEIHEHFAQNAVVGFARLNSNVIGVVANQPSVLAGCLDIDSSNKIARFVRLCDCFNIPLLNLVDVTGYLPGTDQEHNGIIRHGAKILFAFSEASVAKVTLILRKAYGGAFIALASKQMGYDLVLAFADSEIAVMGAQQAVTIIHRKEMKAQKDKEAFISEKVSEYKDMFLHPFTASSRGHIDMIIEPKDARKALISCFSMLVGKRERRPSKKHGNIPL